MILIKRKNIIALIENECPVKFDKEIAQIVLFSESNKSFGTIRFEFTDNSESELSLAFWLDVQEKTSTLTIKFPLATSCLDITL
jgi:hypothetical protein